eukprot:7260894-Prymnesium_polylepis.2
MLCAPQLPPEGTPPSFRCSRVVSNERLRLVRIIQTTATRTRSTHPPPAAVIRPMPMPPSPSDCCGVGGCATIRVTGASMVGVVLMVTPPGTALKKAVAVCTVAKSAAREALTLSACC